ncbi:MAG: J domain-containing protein [Myxococcales bacterium]
MTALRFAQARLLKAIAAKKKSLAKLDARIEETASRMAALGPLRDQLLRLDGEIHRLFKELLARKRQSREVRRALTLVYAFLIRTGVLAPAGWSDTESPRPFAGPAEADDDDDHDDHDEATAGPPRGGRGLSAKRPSDAPDDQTLRVLFRRLAMAVHPDRVSDEAEKARRTEAMKDISRAYAERDLARLLALERQWTEGPPPRDAVPVDESERQCERMEQMNRELRIQLQNLTAELKARRRSPTGRMTDELRRPSREGGADPVAHLAGDLATGLAQLRHVHQRVTAFTDGKLSLEALLVSLALPRPHPRRSRPAGDDQPDLFTDPDGWLRR